MIGSNCVNPRPRGRLATIEVTYRTQAEDTGRLDLASTAEFLTFSAGRTVK
jgi:hypothetical protein